MKTLLIVLGLLVLLVGAVALQAWILMLLVNIIAHYYGFKGLSFTVALCVVGLLNLVPGVSVARSNK